jgi:hypothetical protein
VIRRWKRSYPSYFHQTSTQEPLWPDEPRIVTAWEKWRKRDWEGVEWPANTLFISQDVPRPKHPVWNIAEGSYSAQKPTDWRKWIINQARLLGAEDYDIDQLLRTCGEDTWRLGLALERRVIRDSVEYSPEDQGAQEIYQAWLQGDLNGMIQASEGLSLKSLEQGLARIFTQPGKLNPHTPEHARALRYVLDKWWNEWVFFDEEIGKQHNIIQLWLASSAHSSARS